MKKGKKGFLIVNPYLIGDKFSELEGLLSEAFFKRDLILTVRYSDEFVDMIGDKIDLRGEAGFAVFYDKDHYLAEALESSGLKVFDSSAAIRLCDNKAETCIALKNAGIRIPKTIIAPKTFENVGYNRFDTLDRAISVLGLPLVIKEFYGSFGKQVYLAETRRQAEEILRSVGGKPVIFQEFIKESSGKDLRVNVVGGKVVACIKRSNDNDFRSNIAGGGRAESFEPTKAQEEVALKAAKAVGADWCGVDVLLNDGEPMVIEVNSNMHFAGTYSATGVNVADHMAEHVFKSLLLGN